MVVLEGVCLFLFSGFLGVAGFLEYIFSVMLLPLGKLEILLFDFSEVLLGGDLTGDCLIGDDFIGDGLLGDILLVGELFVIFNELLELMVEALDFLVGRVGWLSLVFGEVGFDEHFLRDTDFLIFKFF